MLSFMLILSFLLHIVMFIAIYFLYQHIQSLKKINTHEVTEIFEHYLQEIKKENARLESEIVQQPLEEHQQPIVNPPTIRQDEQPLENTEVKDYNPPVHMINDEYEPSLEAQVLQLHQQGVAVDDIAKRLDCGKTEATLIIKFSGEKEL